jgi:hypothetical protein
MFQYDLRLQIDAIDQATSMKRGRLREECGEVRDWSESEKRALEEMRLSRNAMAKHIAKNHCPHPSTKAFYERVVRGYKKILEVCWSQEVGE